MSAEQAIKSENLAEAITIATDTVKRNPTQAEARVVLAELMCFSGNLDRADSLIEAASKIRGDNSPGLKLFRQLLRGEAARQQWYDEGRPPEVLSEPTADLSDSMQIVVDYRAKDYNSAASSLARQQEAISLNGTLCLKGGTEASFEGFRDLNDLSAMVAELISGGGKFFLVPWSSIQSIHFEPAQTLRDVLWRPVSCTMVSGEQERYFMPCLYSGSAKATQDAVRLGQSTDWLNHEAGLVSGLGLRMFLAGDSTPTILEVDDLLFEPREITSAG